MGSSSRARFWNGIDAASPLVRKVVMPMLKAFRASSDDVVASTGTSNFWMEDRDSPSLARRLVALKDDTHAASAEFLHDAIMRDGLIDHGATSWYAEDRGKSMSANELPHLMDSQKAWRNVFAFLCSDKNNPKPFMALVQLVQTSELQPD